LLAANKQEVVITLRNRSSIAKIEHLERDRYHNFNLDEHPLSKLFAKYPIDTIINTAISYGRDQTSSMEVVQSNLVYPIQLIEEGMKSQLSCYINTDSYFNKNNLSYSHLLNYSVSKKSLVTWLKYFSNALKIINVIPEHIYGPRDGPQKFVESLVQDIAMHRKPEIALTFGHQRRDFVYVKDVASAFAQLTDMSARDSFRYREYSVGTGETAQIRDIATEIKRISNSPTELNFGALPYRKDEIMSSVADITEMQNIGWFPKYTLDSGLRDLIETYDSKFMQE
jgi:CDP-paratose synthetase